LSCNVLFYIAVLSLFVLYAVSVTSPCLHSFPPFSCCMFPFLFAFPPPPPCFNLWYHSTSRSHTENGIGPMFIFSTYNDFLSAHFSVRKLRVD
jgi:hypothetical protein